MRFQKSVVGAFVGVFAVGSFLELIILIVKLLKMIVWLCFVMYCFDKRHPCSYSVLRALRWPTCEKQEKLRSDACKICRTGQRRFLEQHGMARDG